MTIQSQRLPTILTPNDVASVSYNALKLICR